ncbi:MAG: hypothetical protein HC765_03870 [Brachymonas sp.]|nr:hypothetical protein [Brachymonas sp.]
MRDSFFLLLRRLAWLVCALNASVWAQNAPSTEQMIEQLKAPRTRSLRNLTVEPTPSNQAGTPTSPPR